MGKNKESETNKEEPEFIVLDEDDSVHKPNYPDPEAIIWGISFILAGILLLLNIFNIVPWDIWSYMLRFWPVLIIILGFQIILGSHIISRILLSLITFLLFSWVILVSIHAVSPSLLNSLPKSWLLPVTWWEVIQK